MPRLLHAFFTLLAGSTHADLARQVQYLRTENQILRAKLPTRLRITPGERERLVKFGRPLSDALDALVSIVSPKTFRRWLKSPPPRRKRPRTKFGRPPKPHDVRELIIKMASDNNWGYARIAGELRKLRINVSKSTIKAVLRRRGIDPAPKRGEQSWDDFLAQHAKTLWACDFFTANVWTWRGLVPVFTLVFMHVASRRVIVTPSTRNPDEAWTLRQFEHLSRAETLAGAPPAILLRDNDAKFTARFDQALAARGIKAHRLPYRSPWLNAYVERWIRSLRDECLDHFVVLGHRHLDYLVDEFVDYYHHHRPHQGKENELLTPPAHPPPQHGPITVRTSMGGRLKRYERIAA